VREKRLPACFCSASASSIASSCTASSSAP
jgi:hypothetical protein